MNNQSSVWSVLAQLTFLFLAGCGQSATGEAEIGTDSVSQPEPNKFLVVQGEGDQLQISTIKLDEFKGIASRCSAGAVPLGYDYLKVNSSSVLFAYFMEFHGSETAHRERVGCLEAEFGDTIFTCGPSNYDECRTQGLLLWTTFEERREAMIGERLVVVDKWF